MNNFQERTAASATFRLPPKVLNTVDTWCQQNDVSRSQFFRHAIADRVKALFSQSAAYDHLVTIYIQASRPMKPMGNKRPTRLKDLMKGWKPDKPKTVQQATAGDKARSTPFAKPTKDHKLLRFHQPFDKKLSLSEAAATKPQSAGTSLIMIDRNRRTAEIKAALDGFAADCMAISKDGKFVIAMALGLEEL